MKFELLSASLCEKTWKGQSITISTGRAQAPGLNLNFLVIGTTSKSWCLQKLFRIEIQSCQLLLAEFYWDCFESAARCEWSNWMKTCEPHFENIFMSTPKWPEPALSTFLLLSDAVNPGWPRWRSLFRFWYRVESRCITTTTTTWAGHTKNGQIACGCHHSLNKSSGQGQPTWVIEFLFCSDLCFKSVEKMLFNKFTHTHTYKHTHTHTWGQCHLFFAGASQSNIIIHCCP